MKISEFIENLKYQLETYGDTEVKINWDRHEQLKQSDIFFVRVIGNYEQVEKFTKEQLKKLNPTNNDGLWLQNYPY